MTATKEQLHTMVVADPGAPVKYTWNGVPEDAEQVRAEFEARMATGMYLAYETVLDEGVKKHVQLSGGFKPEAEEIILAPRLAGGC